MNKIRKWLNKPKKEVENQLMIQPSTPEKRHQICQDVTVDIETLCSTLQRLAAQPLALRDLDGGLISQTKTDRSDPDMILTTRLNMLRELLQGGEEVSVQQQHYCLQHFRTMSAWSPQMSPLPVWRSPLQVDQVTGNGTQVEPTDTGSCDIINLSSTGERAADTPASSPQLPVQPFLKTRDNCSLPSSPYPGGRRRLPCSLPCSPLLGGRRWGSTPTSPSPPSRLSRLWVEAALQRSKNIRQTEPHLPPPCSPQVRCEGEEDGVRSRWRETEEEGEEEEWSDEEKGEDKQVKIVGIRLSDTVIFRLKTSPSICGEKEVEEKEEEEKEEEESHQLGLDSEMSRYCLLTPCVCFRCPSAPPYDAEVFSDIQTVSSFSSEDQKDSEGLTEPSHRTNVQKSDIQRTDVQRMDIQRSGGGSELSLHKDRAPQLRESSHLYPSLSLWRITADSQTELNRKQEEEVNSSINQSCFHGNNTDGHLQRLCELISGVPGELQICSADLKKVFDSTTCTKRTARPVEFCSFCSDKLGAHIMKHLCRNCDQVFCVRCLCHFVSLLQIHQLSQTAAV